MLEKLVGLIVLAGLILSVAGSIMSYESIKITGNLVLLITATIAGFMFIRFYVMTPINEFVGTCIEQKRFFSHYILTFRSGGSGIYSGRAGLQLGEKIKIGDKVKVKVKGQNILEINKIN